MNRTNKPKMTSKALVEKNLCKIHGGFYENN